MKKIIFAAGGTGGHIFPALAVAQLCKIDHEILWVGATGGIENKILGTTGIPICNINISGLRKSGILRLLVMPFLLLRAFIQSALIILRERPSVIVGFGGYVTFPICFMGGILRIPVVIHEQNSVAGLANKVLAKLASRVIVAFPHTLIGKKTLLLGNPVRSEIAGIAPPELRYATRTGSGLNVLVLGGSLGAQIFNTMLPEVFSIIQSKQPGYVANITHQVGRGTLEDVAREYKKFGIMHSKVLSFIDDIADAYANADLLISRSGASTISEVCVSGIAAIFVPYPYAVDDHQRHNAAALVNAKAAIMFTQTQLSISGLVDTLLTLDRDKCSAMANRAKELAINNSSEKIKQLITSLIVD